jgi:hypothetical protein
LCELISTTPSSKGDSVGSILVEVGNAYLHVGGKQRNGTALFRFLIFPGQDTAV